MGRAVVPNWSAGILLAAIPRLEAGAPNKTAGFHDK